PIRIAPAGVVDVLTAGVLRIQRRREAGYTVPQADVGDLLGEAGDRVAVAHMGRARIVVLGEADDPAAAERGVGEHVEPAQDAHGGFHFEPDVARTVGVAGTRHAELVETAAGYDLVAEVHVVHVRRGAVAGARER